MFRSLGPSFPEEFLEFLGIGWCLICVEGWKWRSGRGETPEFGPIMVGKYWMSACSEFGWISITEEASSEEPSAFHLNFSLMLQLCCWSEARREAERRLQHRRVLEKKTRRRLWHLEFILWYRLFYSGHGVHKYSFLLDTGVIEDRAGFLQAVRVLQRLCWTMQLASAQRRLLPQVLNRPVLKEKFDYSTKRALECNRSKLDFPKVKSLALVASSFGHMLIRFGALIRVNVWPLVR